MLHLQIKPENQKATAVCTELPRLSCYEVVHSYHASVFPGNAADLGLLKSVSILSQSHGLTHCMTPGSYATQNHRWQLSEQMPRTFYFPEKPVCVLRGQRDPYNWRCFPLLWPLVRFPVQLWYQCKSLWGGLYCDLAYALLFWLVLILVLVLGLFSMTV